MGDGNGQWLQNLQTVAPTSQSGAPGSTLAYNFDVIDLGICESNGVSGAITITSDTTGGATVTPGGFSGINGRYAFPLTLGPNPGTVSIVIHCDIACSPTPSLTYQVNDTNTGTARLTNVQVEDQLTTPSIATCTNVAVGATCVLTGTYTVTTADAATGSITNIGSASSNELPDGENTLPLVITVFGGGSGPATLTIVSGDNQNVGCRQCTGRIVRRPGIPAIHRRAADFRDAIRQHQGAHRGLAQRYRRPTFRWPRV